MVMKYDLNASESDEPSGTNINTTIAADKSSATGIARMKKNLRNSSGICGEIALPEAAPLVFPGLDEINDENKQNRLKSMSKFASDYFDKRSQLFFVSKLHSRCPLLTYI